MTLTENLHLLLTEVVADWDEWILKPEARLDLVTRGLLDSGHKSDDRLYRRLRQKVDYIGSSQNTAMSLYAHLNSYRAGPIDGFVEAFADEFEARVRDQNTNHGCGILHDLYQVKQEP